MKIYLIEDLDLDENSLKLVPCDTIGVADSWEKVEELIHEYYLDIKEIFREKNGKITVIRYTGDEYDGPVHTKITELELNEVHTWE